MTKTTLILGLLISSALAGPAAEKKPEILPLSPAPQAEKPVQPDTSAATDKTPSAPETKTPELPKVESIGADGTVKLAEISNKDADASSTKNTEPASDQATSSAPLNTEVTPTDKANDEAAFDTKAIDPNDVPSAETLTVPAAAPSSFNPAQQADIEKIVASYIEQHPETLVKAIQAYGEQQQKEMLQKEAEKMTKFKQDLMDDKTAIVGGNPNGTVSLVVFTDPNCPHCRHFEVLLNEVKSLYSNLKIYFRPWPIMGKDSIEVVAGLTAAAKQGYDKYDALSMRIATSNDKIDKAKFLKLAKDLGIDTKKLQKSMDSDPVKNDMKFNNEIATKMGLDATPTVIMFDADGTKILMPGDKDSLKKALTEAKA